MLAMNIANMKVVAMRNVCDNRLNLMSGPGMAPSVKRMAARSWTAVRTAALCMLMAGCATTIQSEVTAFHEWPDQLPDKSFVFERSAAQENNLEYRSYENLVRAELIRLG